jgi:hypothetical protein
MCRFDQADSRTVPEGEPTVFACIYERIGALSPAGTAAMAEEPRLITMS